MNKNSQLYRLPEIFDIYKQNKESIDVHYEQSESEADFKNPKPRDIYHLSLSNQMNSLNLGDGAQASLVNGHSAVPRATNGSTAGSGESAGQSVADGSSQFPTASDALADSPSQSAMLDSTKPALLTPDQINWYYLDPSGNQQGPFNGDLMHNWFQDGYLNLDLLVKRQNGGDYQPLKHLCESLNDFVTPFKVALPAFPEPSATPAQASQIQDPSQAQSHPQAHGDPHQDVHSQVHPLVGSSLLNNSLINQPLFNDPLTLQQMYPFQMNNINSMNILQNQIPMSHQPTNQMSNPVISRTNSNWGDLAGNYSSPSTPIASMSSAINPLIGQSITQPTLQPTPMSPWTAIQGSRIHSSSRVSSPFVPPVDDINPNVLNGILGDSDAPRQQSSIESKSPSDNTSSNIIQPNVVVAEEIVQPNVVTAEEIVQPNVVTAEEIIQPNVVTNEEIVQPNIVVPEESVPAPAATTTVPKVAKSKKVEKLPVDETKEEPVKAKVEQSTQAKESKAPWAAATMKSTPKLTLKEIQKLESEKLEKQRQLEAQAQSELQLKALKEELAREEQNRERAKKSLPAISNWAKSASQVKVTKTLAEIQEEERKLAEANKKKTSSSSSLAATIGASAKAPVEEGWSTVAKKVTKKPSTPSLAKSSLSYSAAATGASNTMPNPDALRSISSATPVKTDNSHAIREEFVIWARSQMVNLYPSVSANDLLEMFISLPNNQDSVSLISETIYASSTTMNGRVFAQDFLKKKLHYNKQIANPGDLTAWSLAIASSADKLPVVDDEGWSTTKKKKGRK